MTRFILVICQNSNIRRFCVDNLVTRGYIAVGVASADEGKEVLHHLVPEFIILCAEPKLAEVDINKVRNFHVRLTAVPILLVSMEHPNRAWLQEWNVAAQFPYPIDARRLVDLLMPWLQSKNEEKDSMNASSGSNQNGQIKRAT
jgi:hypothetical protein